MTGSSVAAAPLDIRTGLVVVLVAALTCVACVILPVVRLARTRSRSGERGSSYPSGNGRGALHLHEVRALERAAGEALSTLGGIFRAGFFIGPFLAAAFIHLTGSTQTAFWIHIVACLLAAGVLLVLPDPMKAVRAQRAAASGVPEAELLEGKT